MAGRMASTSPTRPRSYSTSSPSGPFRFMVSFFAAVRPASEPERPTALPPCWLMSLTMPLFVEPASTISTTPTVSSSVTRSPSTNSLVLPIFLSVSPIWGPPPWTTTTLMPTYLRSTTSWAKGACSSGRTWAAPPYLTTTVLPANCWM